MTGQQAAAFVKLTLAGIDREYPNKPGVVLRGPGDLRTPREMHPVFYGHFDWHSSVHGHWMLLRLLKRFPGADFAADLRRTLDDRWTKAALQTEADYFEIEDHRSFERMYGWAWALRLAIELREWDDPQGRTWAAHFRPLEEKLVALAMDYLPKLDWPVRCGFHPESSFALAQLLDYARSAENPEFEALLVRKANQFYGNDRDYPATYEPSGNDFFSPGLNEADLMRRVLPQDAFSCWLDGFLPGLDHGKAGHLLEPVSVSDVTDGQIMHLAGLNLNRAWTMLGIASSLPPGDPRRQVLESSATRHRDAGLALVHSGYYEGEHWLASFAVYLLDGVGR